MLRVSRNLFIAVISASLVCSPLFALHPGASHNSRGDKPVSAPPSTLSQHEPGVLLVRFLPETTQQSQDFILRSAGKTYKRLPNGIVKLTLRDNFDLNETLDNLRKLDAAVEWVEPNYIVKRVGDVRNVRNVRSPGFSRKRATHNRLKVGLRTTGLRTTVVALIDTGVDRSHRDLRHALADNNGWNFITGDDDFSDDNGHGTQIAGIIAQSAISNLKSSILILPLKALDKSGEGTIADVVEAMDYALDHHAAVINCSFGAPAYSRAMLEAIQRAETAGIVVVAAAGNNGKGLSQASFYPASYRLPNLLSVAATDHLGSLAQFSNFDADIAAPGVGIRTAHRGNRQVSLTGTSASAGFVTGAAAMLKSNRGWVAARTIRETLLKSADRTVDLAGKVTSGGVNPAAAIGLFTRNNANPSKAPAPIKRMTPAIKAALQSGANLDTLRSSQPQAPPAWQQTDTLPPATYDDPKPANTANYDIYLTDMSRNQNAVGIAGSKPMQQVDPMAGSASVGGWSYNLESKVYNFTAPVVSLPGRAGLGASLALSYNNKMWTSTTGGQVFNLDRGFPAPGWHIGFGHIQVRTGDSGIYYNSVTQKSSIIFVAPDGTRHDLAYNSATSRFESYDSSYISFDATAQILYFPSGLKMKYGAYSYDPNTYDHQALPIEVKDRNGNLITINYKTLTFSSSPLRTKVVIDYVTDTAGRRIDFNYQNNRLVSISQNRGGMVFTYAYIDYQPVTIQTNYTNTDPANINGMQVYFPSRITYPTGVNFRFNYSGYGQILAIEKWVPAIAGQGAERKIASTTFGYYDPTLSTQYFIHRNEWSENGPGGTYQYNYDTIYGHELSDPSQRRFRVLKSGMTLTTRLFPAGSDNPTKTNQATYISDSGVSYTANPRVSQTQINGARTVNYSYIQQDGMWLVQNQDEMQSSTLYRRTTTSYTSYPSQYILGLPQQVSVYNGNNTLLSRVTNNYDETGSYTDSNGQNAPYWIDESGAGVIQHNTAYGAGFTQRGNLTSVVQSSVVNGSVTATRTVKRISYDTNGNLRAEADGANHRKQILYTDNYSNKPGGVGQTHVHPYTIADPTGFRAGSQWNYYTGQTIKTFNLTPGSSTEAQAVETSYDFTDRPLQTMRPDGGWVKTTYWDNWLAAVSSQLVETGKTRYKFDQMNGVGAAFKKASDHPDGVAGKYSGQITVFNSIGEAIDSSNVIAIDGGWTPAAEDASTGFLFTHLTRDELSRLKYIAFPDNNSRQFDYTGCGCAGNTDTRVTDEMGHYTETKTDFLGRLSEAIEPSGTTYDGVYSKAQYVYDELDRLITINHSKTPNQQTGQTPTQTRTFIYDGYGRLVSENTPEGGLVNYTYTANDLVATAANQRNITVTNSYNTRNLVTSVSYSDGTPAATFAYDAFGARISMSDGEGGTSYAYNSYRQLQSETRTFTALTGKSYVLSYTYNLADQLRSVNYNIVTGGSFMAPSRDERLQRQAQRPDRVIPDTQVVRANPADSQSKVNITAPAATYTISGTVRDSQSQPISGVTMRLSGARNYQATTNSGGNYSFSSLNAGFYTVTPSLAGYTFSPTSTTYNNLTSNKPNTNFTGTLATYAISGRVTNSQGMGISGVTLTLSGGAGQTATSDANGNYSFSNLPYGGNYTVTASKSGYSFSPPERSYLNLTANVTNADFTGTPLPPPPSGFNKTINYAYNSVGALSGVGTNLIGSDSTNSTNVLNTVTYRGSGALKSLLYGNGLRLQMGYNANRQQPVSMKVDRASNPSDRILDYAYEYYDANGKNNNRIRKITDNVDASYTTDYTYDEYDRLTYATAPAYSRYYNHDEWGNIKNFAGLTLNHATNASGAPATNRLASDGSGFNYTYDAAGNQTNAPGFTYLYDGANRLKTVNGGTATYGYDGDGMKTQETAGGSPVYYVRSSVLGIVAMEVNAAGARRAYVFVGGKLLAQQSYDGQFYWMHTDHLGSGRKMTDATGVVKYRSEFDPYGQTVMSWAASGDTEINSKRFATYERDTASGLDYANARMYNGGRGRFTQADPIRDKAADLKKPESLNLYSYARNDSANNTDPTGTLLANPNDPSSGGGGCTGYGWGYILGDGSYSVISGFWACPTNGGGGGGGGQSPQEECPVTELEAITDPIAQRFESGQTIDTDNLTQAMKDGLACFQKAVQDAGGNFNLSSAYRPPAYQAHLRDLWDKWQQIRNNNSATCRDRRARIQREYQRHRLLDNQRPALNSAHTRGEAIDANITGLPEGQDVDTIAGGCSLYRPIPVNDPVHFIHR